MDKKEILNYINEKLYEKFEHSVFCNVFKLHELSEKFNKIVYGAVILDMANDTQHEKCFTEKSVDSVIKNLVLSIEIDREITGIYYDEEGNEIL